MRPIFRLSVALCLLLLLQGFAQDHLDVKLFQAFNKTDVHAVSPDGTKMFVEDWGKPGWPCRLVEISTGTTLKNYEIKPRILIGDYFADGQSVFYSNDDVDYTLLDLQTDKRTTVKSNDSRSIYVKESSDAIRDLKILVRFIGNTPLTQDLVLVEFPSYREIAKVPYAITPRKFPVPVDKWGIPIYTEFDIKISNDRNVLVYSYDHLIICRRTDNLDVIWSRKTEPHLFAYDVNLSCNGDYVVAQVADTSITADQKEYYIGVFDGKTGSELKRFPSMRSRSEAISPDGKYLAIDETKLDRARKLWIIQVHIYDVLSGRKLSSILHDEIKDSKYSWIQTGMSIQFTSDGKYLITSGMNTKVWKISRN
jgi:hypothetical protein